MPFSVPAVDKTVCATWNEIELDTYHSAPFYFAKITAEYRKTYSTHTRMVGKRDWLANQGPIMKGVRKDRSPHIRQEATPQEIGKLAKADYIDLKELAVETTPKKHRFRSRMFNFLPSFRDFMKDHVFATLKDINEKMLRFEEVFIRTGIFHMAPHIYICGTGAITKAPMWDGKDMDNLGIIIGKTVANRINWIGQIPANDTNLSIRNVFMVDSIIREDLRVPPWSGGGMMRDSAPLQEKNVLVCSNEAYTQFIGDPYFLKFKQLDLNVITAGFKGDLFGTVICRIEDLPLRMMADGTFPAPETRELNPDAYNFGETVGNDDYLNAPYEWAFFYGAEGYESIDVGPPPADFTGGSVPKDFNKMNWNGEARISKNFLVPCLDEAGNQTMDTNDEGEHLQIRATGTYGLIGIQRRNVVPILFRRKRGLDPV